MGAANSKAQQMSNTELSQEYRKLVSLAEDIKRTRREENGANYDPQAHLDTAKLHQDFVRITATIRGGHIPIVGSFIATNFVQRVNDRLSQTLSQGVALSEDKQSKFGAVGTTALVCTLVTAGTYTIQHFMHHWNDDNFWESLVVGLLISSGVGVLSGGLATAFTFIIQHIASKFGLDVLKQMGSSVLKEALKAIPFLSFVSWLASSLWSFFYDYLIKQRISLTELMKDVFLVNTMSAFCSSFLSVFCTSVGGPFGMVLYIIGSILMSLVVAELFAKRDQKHEIAEIEAYLQDRLKLNRGADVDDVFCCPVMLDTFSDAVSLKGFFFERAFLTTWLSASDVHPLTKEEVSMADITEEPEFNALVQKMTPLYTERKKRFTELY